MKSSAHFKHLLISDLSGVERAKTIWCENGEVNSHSAGWIPSNALITCFGDLAPSEMPEVGDVKLVEINENLVTLNQLSHTSAAKFSICAIENLDQTPWHSCLRSQLEKAIKRLEETFGIQLRVGLEQEFYLIDSTRNHLNAYSLQSFFEEEDFCVCGGSVDDKHVGVCTSCQNNSANKQRRPLPVAHVQETLPQQLQTGWQRKILRQLEMPS